MTDLGRASTLGISDVDEWMGRVEFNRIVRGGGNDSLTGERTYWSLGAWATEPIRAVEPS